MNKQYRCVLMYNDEDFMFPSHDLETDANVKILYGLDSEPSLPSSLVKKMKEVYEVVQDFHEQLCALQPQQRPLGWNELVVFDDGPIDAMFGLKYTGDIISKLMIDALVLDQILILKKECDLGAQIHDDLLRHLSLIDQYISGGLNINEMIPDGLTWKNDATLKLEQISKRVHAKRDSIVSLLSSGWH